MWDITYTSLLTHPLFFRYPSHPSVEEAHTPSHHQPRTISPSPSPLLKHSHVYSLWIQTE